MRFLVDESISWWVAEQLAADGHDAVHVRDLSLLGSPDETIFERARIEERTVIAADTDYGTIAARLRAPGPSIILFRFQAPDLPREQVRLLREALSHHHAAIAQGVIMVFDGSRLRIRSLPIE